MSEDRDPLFDDYINEIYESIAIAGVEFWAADILFNCDPIAYRVYKSDWQSEFEDEA